MPNLHNAECLYLFGAGREKRLYAVPPHTKVEPLEFEDVWFHIENFKDIKCASSGYSKAYMDEMFQDDKIKKKYYVNDSNFLDKLLANESFIQHSNKYLKEISDAK